MIPTAYPTLAAPSARDSMAARAHLVTFGFYSAAFIGETMASVVAIRCSRPEANAPSRSPVSNAPPPALAENPRRACRRALS